MKLIGSTLSPYAMRVILAARFKGIELDVMAPEGGPRGATHLRVNPAGKIPVLVDGSVVLPESDVILAYFEDRFADPTLYPGDAAARANIRLMVRLLDNFSAPSLGPFLPGADPAATALAIESIDQALGYVDHFRRDGSHASGDVFSAADCAWIPFFHYFERLEATHGVFGLVRKRPRLEAWWMQARTTPLAERAGQEIDEAIATLLQQG